MLKIKKIFTLMELIAVVIIIGILAVIALPTYRKAVLKVRDREAQAMLKLIKEAERLYQLDYETYTNCTDTANCNALLDLDISSQYWNFSVSGANSTQFCARAHTLNSAQTQYDDWYISEAMDEPSTAGCVH